MIYGHWEPVECYFPDYVPEYDRWRWTMYALQVALRRRHKNTMADHMLRAAMSFLDDVLRGMPPETVDDWGYLCRLSKSDLTREARKVTDREDSEPVDNPDDDPPF